MGSIPIEIILDLSNDFETNSDLLFSKVINPMSKSLSIVGLKIKPLFLSNLSLLFETRQGFIWLAVSILLSVIPVIGQNEISSKRMD